ncbi:MAG: type II toxin-antitoxin system VapC family toxin [Frankiaceae bacterium]|nr:type II toxin-antitoxin system VapC family toxin [Frankiaceae bacterium]
MSLLLDTHVLLWLAAGDPRLGPRTQAAVLGAQSHVSAISVWEIAIKSATGRLTATGLDAVLEAQDFPELSFTGQHGREAGALPPHHRDPFDRALIAQARAEGLVLATADRRLQAYDVALLDASR